MVPPQQPLGGDTDSCRWCRLNFARLWPSCLMTLHGMERSKLFDGGNRSTERCGKTTRMVNSPWSQRFLEIQLSSPCQETATGRLSDRASIRRPIVASWHHMRPCWANRTTATRRESPTLALEAIRSPRHVTSRTVYNQALINGWSMIEQQRMRLRAVSCRGREQG